MQDQIQHAHLLLETLASLEERGATPARSKTIKTQYERVADSYAVDPLTTVKSIQSRLSDHHSLGFLQWTNRNRGENSGQCDEYGLDLGPEIVLDSSDESETERDR
ncbi:orc1/cdc6 family replication initiation protein [Halorubrum coriense DSM 10284]|uniref:Orc1/cdc6 family replication initiation protein n=1 Tax=Halorubrum coriense DSM 10284 TaxID=1227466 RepID=M0ESV3_9EURY|nr:orc1/cdc6 family replication initiation protein [Halorubrum coriense]ELZ50780.1 orc1/cdc6 family replication initiation protein [Halorubrum coriense DSM 10284]